MILPDDDESSLAMNEIKRVIKPRPMGELDVKEFELKK